MLCSTYYIYSNCMQHQYALLSSRPSGVLQTISEILGIICDGLVPAGLICRDYISCGAMTLDIALGGGFPKGRIVEVGPTPCLPQCAPQHLRRQALLRPKAQLADADHQGGEHHVSQVFGPESSGKTTLAMHAIAEVQRQGGTAALIDAEHAFDPVYSKVTTCLLQLLDVFVHCKGVGPTSYIWAAVRSSKAVGAMQPKHAASHHWYWS